MHRVLPAVIFLLVMSAPVLAQVDPDALAGAKKLYEAAELSADAEKTLYCANAFNIRALRLATASRAGEAAAERERATALLARADKLLDDAGIAADRRSKLSEAMGYIVMSQVVDGSEKPQYGRNDCLALLPDGK